KARLTAALLGSAASVEEPQIQQSPAELWLSPGATAELNCSISGSPRRANWYREKPDGSLEWIYWSAAASKPNGKYSGTVRARGIFSLSISDVQREDSGYYYSTEVSASLGLLPVLPRVTATGSCC
uniref:Ig-like domain-containing protein n=1 Tax=Anas zonorhyncha TaxID=75864 RepID=A0A8B9ZV06_9AVES